MENAKSISLEEEESFRSDYLKSEKNSVVRHSLALNEFNQSFCSNDSASDNQFTFSVEHKTLPVTNQKKSGRCWIFSASNILREIIAKKAGIESMFEISQNFIAFYDKLEKSNFVMESVIDMIDKEPSDRKLMFVLQNGVGDGGQWDMYVNLVKKYGVCPKADMVETFQSSNTAESNSLLNSSLKKFAFEAQKLYKGGKSHSDIEKLKGEYLEKIYILLTDCYGVPPKSFDFEYKDSRGIYHIERMLNPKSFFDKYIGSAIDEYVSVINAPTKDKPYDKTYTIEYLGNVVGGKRVTHLNLRLARFKELIVSQLKGGDLVWFGADVSKYRAKQEGVWSDKSFDFKTPFGLDHRFEKAGMLDYFSSAMNHAMVLTGFDEKDGKIIRWKIENSWGEENGNKGFYIMSDSFFDSYVYQAAILRKYLSEEEKSALTAEPKLLEPWDPFGTLAD